MYSASCSSVPGFLSRSELGAAHFHLRCGCNGSRDEDEGTDSFGHSPERQGLSPLTHLDIPLALLSLL